MHHRQVPCVASAPLLSPIYATGETTLKWDSEPLGTATYSTADEIRAAIENIYSSWWAPLHRTCGGPDSKQGILPMMVEEAITFGTRTLKLNGTVNFYSKVNKLCVVLNDKGEVVTIGFGVLGKNAK